MYLQKSPGYLPKSHKYIRKRAVLEDIQKRVAFMIKKETTMHYKRNLHVWEKALYIHKKAPYTSAKEPYIVYSQKSRIMTHTREACLHDQGGDCHVLQKSSIYPQKSSIYPPKRPTYCLHERAALGDIQEMIEEEVVMHCRKPYTSARETHISYL
mmetsp:Transcript_73863/g.119874  ORF Transcript_73863/g.119874 Transcript_73863/m.119874 type:complete len:155 (+) Transcript_73863:277-741(+)